MNEKQILPPSNGTTLKFSVTADLGKDIHMSDVSFKCEFLNKYGKKMLVEKANMVYVSDDEYIAVVDTRLIGTGEYWMRFTAEIPDTDVDGGLRTEVVTVPTGINITQ